MALFLDARTPVRLVDSPSPGAMVLAEDGAGVAGAAHVERFATPVETAHPIGCACCQPRLPPAIALDRLFLGRVQGRLPWFKEVEAVVATEAGAEAVNAVLQLDPVISGRFRPA
jgi:hypothetical protein